MAGPLARGGLFRVEVTETVTREGPQTRTGTSPMSHSLAWVRLPDHRMKKEAQDNSWNLGQYQKCAGALQASPAFAGD